MPRQKETVLIAGAAGFLGAYLARACKENGYEVIGIGRSKSQHNHCKSEIIVADLAMTPWEDVLRKYRPRTIFHLAATASVQASVADPVGDFSRVIPGTARLVNDLARISPKTHLVFFSSAAIYGNPASLPINELDACQPISPYGMNKYVVERLLYAATHCYGLQASVLRIFSAFGAGLKRQIFFDLHQKIVSALSERRSTVELFGTGNESRDFIHASDVAHAALLVADLPATGYNEYNVASGVETSISSATAQYLSLFQAPIGISFNGASRPGDPLRWQADVQKLFRLGFRPQTSLADGLREYKIWLEIATPSWRG